MTAFLQIANIETLYFDRIYALHGLTLEIKEKEIFASSARTRRGRPPAENHRRSAKRPAQEREYRI
jgi:hypothetical protein